MTRKLIPKSRDKNKYMCVVGSRVLGGKYGGTKYKRDEEHEGTIYLSLAHLIRVII